MPEKVKEAHPHRGLARLAWRSGILIYRLGLGGLVGERLLLLQHTGRKSGKARLTVLESVYLWIGRRSSCSHTTANIPPCCVPWPESSAAARTAAKPMCAFSPG